MKISGLIFLNILSYQSIRICKLFFKNCYISINMISFEKQELTTSQTMYYNDYGLIELPLKLLDATQSTTMFIQCLRYPKRRHSNRACNHKFNTSYYVHLRNSFKHLQGTLNKLFVLQMPRENVKILFLFQNIDLLHIAMICFNPNLEEVHA